MRPLKLRCDLPQSGYLLLGEDVPQLLFGILLGRFHFRGHRLGSISHGIHGCPSHSGVNVLNLLRLAFFQLQVSLH